MRVDNSSYSIACETEYCLCYAERSSVMQYQSRQKLIRALLVWKAQGGRGKANEQSASGGEQESGNAPGGADMCEPIVGRNTVEKRNFAFVHLFLNLKDRCLGDRLPSEYIPALGRIRTDLDQFSYIEREALMYHGYTLIDAQLKRTLRKLFLCTW